MILPLDGQEFSETNVVKSYEETRLQLGSVLVYSGAIINKATDLLRKKVCSMQKTYIIHIHIIINSF